MSFQTMPTYLLNGVTANGAGVGQPLGSPRVFTLYVQSANFGDGTVNIEMSGDNVNWTKLNYNGAVFAATQNFIVGFTNTTMGQYLRAFLSGATSPSPFYVYLL